MSDFPTLTSLLRHTSKLMVEQITAGLEASGFPDSPPRFHAVFENLDAEGTRLTVLAARTGHTHQAIGEVVSELEARGYVERVPDPADGRARLVRPTKQGMKLLRAAVKVIDAMEAEWRERWGIDPRAALEAAMWDVDPEWMERKVGPRDGS